MKRRNFAIVTLVLTLLLSMTMFFGCGKKTKVTVNGDNVSFVAETVEGTPTMGEFMQQLQEEGSLTVRVENGSIVEINGKANSVESGIWVLYSTCGAPGVNNNGKSLEVSGNFYYPAENADTITVNQNQFYIWHYQTA